MAWHDGDVDGGGGGISIPSLKNGEIWSASMNPQNRPTFKLKKLKIQFLKMYPL